MNGFSPHAAVRCSAEDRRSPVQLCRYTNRPDGCHGRKRSAHLFLIDCNPA